MNIEKLSRRGLKYTRNASKVWYNRWEKLVQAWGTAQDKKLSEGRIQRLWVISTVYYEWYNEAMKIYFEQMRKTDEERRVMEETTYIMLECPRFECRYGPDAMGYGVKYKNYEEGKLKCEKCGQELRLQEQRQVDMMLNDLGIHI